MMRLPRIARLVRPGKPDTKAATSEKTRLFELKESLSRGGSAEAYERREVSPGALETDVESTFTVHDDIGDRRGVGRDDGGSGGHGAYGKALRLPGSDTWWIVDLQCPPEEEE
jgi:hypothetical protein